MCLHGNFEDYIFLQVAFLQMIDLKITFLIQNYATATAEAK